jgi:hypothetical protein
VDWSCGFAGGTAGPSEGSVAGCYRSGQSFSISLSAAADPPPAVPSAAGNGRWTRPNNLCDLVSSAEMSSASGISVLAVRDAESNRGCLLIDGSIMHFDSSVTFVVDPIAEMRPTLAQVKETGADAIHMEGCDEAWATDSRTALLPGQDMRGIICLKKGWYIFVNIASSQRMIDPAQAEAVARLVLPRVAP